MKRILTLCIGLAAMLPAAVAQTAARWAVYPALHNSTQNQIVDGVVYSLSNGTVFSYNPADTEVRAFTKISGMSDVEVSQMGYSSAQRALLLAYANGNIDVWFTGSGRIVNMPQFMNSSLFDHTVNDVTANGNYAYLAHPAGITVVNIAKCEFTNTYILSKNVSSAVRSGNRILAFCSDGVWAGSTSSNLLDPANWTQVSTAAYTKSRLFGGNVYALSSAGLYNLGADGTEATRVVSGSFAWLSPQADQLLCGNTSSVYSIAADGAATRIMSRNSISWISRAGNTFWASCGSQGLVPYQLADGTLVASGPAVVPNSPTYNYCDNMNYSPTTGKFWVGGGSLNYVRITYEGLAYSFDGSTFLNLPDTMSRATGLPYINVTDVVEDPTEPGHVFVSSARTGLYEFRNGVYQKHHDFTENGAHLYSAVSASDPGARQYVRVTGLKFDQQGNLWILNSEVDTVLQVLKKDGTWRGFYIPDVAHWPTFDHIMFDAKGRVWLTHRRTTAVHHAAVVCLDYGGTLDDYSDDRSMARYRFNNQDGDEVQPILIRDICEDKEGQIWVATYEGPYVISNPDEFMNENFNFTQIKIPRNDGTDFADYLLDGVPTSCFAVDGANRKWIGTDGDGLYLISADNMTQLAHYTKENSPLLSNTILSLAINPQTGFLLVGTNEGLMSFSSDVTEHSSHLTDDNIKVYPNPVRPDYYGVVTISGLPDGAEVKIATTGGQVIAKGTASGDSFVWDGFDSNGNRPATGVYYIFVSTSDGSKSAKSRLVVIR